MNAVITAGGRVGGEFARLAGTEVKALAGVRGRTMLEFAVEAARDAGARAIAVVGGDEVRAACAGQPVVVIAESDEGRENVRRALRAWPENEALLYMTSDLPYVRGQHVRDFVRRVEPGIFAMAVSSYGAFARRFPDSPPFGMRIGSESVVNGGVFMMPPGAVQRIETIAMRFFESRKSRLRMLRLTGVGLALAYGIGRLSIAQIERRARRLLGIEAAAIRDCAPELGFDVDALEEYEYARAHE